PRCAQAQTEVVFRLIAAVASFFVTAQTALPLALACCSAPAAHECCASAQSHQSNEPELGHLPCCRSESKAVSTRKDEALNASVSRTWPTVPVVAMALKVPVVAV